MNTSKPRSTTEFLGYRAKIRLPNVDEALNIGHAIHGADDPALSGTRSQAVAQKIVDDFLALQAMPGTAEVPYLAAVRGIARSYGRALTRRKEQYVRDNEAAYAEHKRRESQIRSGRWSSQGFGVWWRLLGPILLGLIGFFVAQVIGEVVPEKISDKTGTGMPSLILAVGFVFAGRMIARWWYDRKRDRITWECNSRLYLAFQAYEKGKLTDYHFHRRLLCEAWKLYTGEEYPEMGSYQFVTEGDIETRKRLEEHLMLHNKSDIERLQEIVKYLGSKIWRNGRKKLPEPEVVE